MDIKKLKGKYYISVIGDYIVFRGDDLVIFKMDGSFVARRSDLRNVTKIVSLGNDRLLLDDSWARTYAVISTKDGTDVWKIKYPKRDTSKFKFLISPDTTMAFDLYSDRYGDHLAMIDLEERKLEALDLKVGLSCVADLDFDENGELCLLETQGEMIEDEHMSSNGIRYIRPDDIDPGGAYYWKNKWQSTFVSHARFFFGDTETILTDDLQLYHHRTGQSIPLLDDDRFDKNARLSSWIKTTCGRYIILRYQRMHVVVDIQTRKMVARYQASYRNGCLIGDEYWICTEEGIVRKPFPLIEDIPPEKYVFWKPYLK